jgi:hypothetical protein
LEVFVWFWDEWNTGFIKWVSFPSLSIPWNSLRRVGIVLLQRSDRVQQRNHKVLYFPFLGNYCCFNFILCYRSSLVINVLGFSFGWS